MVNNLVPLDQIDSFVNQLHVLPVDFISVRIKDFVVEIAGILKDVFVIPVLKPLISKGFLEISLPSSSNYLICRGVLACSLQQRLLSLRGLLTFI